ncbi:MAG TPA: glycosyltransferase family 4 protein [Thermoleophilaceae bacterium]
MSDRYRVLLVTDAYAPMIGGADRSVQLLAAGLARRGHGVAVATAWQRRLPATEERDGIPVHRLRDLTSRVPFVSDDPYKHVPPPFPDPEAVLRFRRLFRRFAPDVVHSYGWLTYSCAAALSGTAIPLVLSIRDYGNLCAVRTLVRFQREPCSGPAPVKCLECAAQHYGRAKGAVAVGGVLGGRRLLARRARGAHFNSAHTRRVAWQHLLAGRTRIARGSPADAAVPPFLGEAPAGPPDAETLARVPEGCILFVGALRRVKGVPELLEAYGRLPAPPPLVLIGTREIDTPRSFPPGVTVLESVAHATVMAAWDRALFGVFPSRLAEPFGNVVHEAMSRGRAAIGTTPGGHSELIVDGESGLLVPSGDVDALTAAIRRLIDDGALRDRLATAARERARLFAAERALPRIEELYRAAIDGAAA